MLSLPRPRNRAEAVPRGVRRLLAITAVLTVILPAHVALADPPPTQYPTPATGPITAAVVVDTLTAAGGMVGASSQGVGGIAVSNGTAYVVDGARVLRVDTATGAASLLAG
jgi:hypothetical protein